jgi:CobB/CobQ-like glutamine amidotransferase domain
VSGYEIHHGTVEVSGARPWFTNLPGDYTTALDGCQVGAISGTLWHGIFENDQFRRSYLTQAAGVAGRDFIPAVGTCFAAARQAQFDALADAIDASLDTGRCLSHPTRPHPRDTADRTAWRWPGASGRTHLYPRCECGPGCEPPSRGRRRSGSRQGLCVDPVKRGVEFIEVYPVPPGRLVCQVRRQRCPILKVGEIINADQSGDWLAVLADGACIGLALGRSDCAGVGLCCAPSPAAMRCSACLRRRPAAGASRLGSQAVMRPYSRLDVDRVAVLDRSVTVIPSSDDAS